MSTPIALEKPAADAAFAAPTTPPAGPESKQSRARIRSMGTSVPLDAITCRRDPGESADATPWKYASMIGARYASTHAVIVRSTKPIPLVRSLAQEIVLKPTSRKIATTRFSWSGFVVLWRSDTAATGAWPSASTASAASRKAASSSVTTLLPSAALRSTTPTTQSGNGVGF